MVRVEPRNRGFEVGRAGAGAPRTRPCEGRLDQAPGLALSLGAAMTRSVCASCGQEFLVRPQSPNQTYCPDLDCQRERRRRWTQAKLKADPDYRANQLAAQRAWHARHPDYWQTYRRRQSAEPPNRSESAAGATIDASICGAEPHAGRWWMEIRTSGPNGLPQSVRVELTLTRPPFCKD